MKVSRERLFSESGATGFRAELLEKVFHLLGLLEGFRCHPFLGERFVLKGGTALNLFLFQVPRISMDIDLNYVGDWRAELMVAERGAIEGAVEAVCSREGLTVRRKPEEHASTNWSLRYESAMGGGGDLEIDLNFMFRTPLWGSQVLDSHRIGSHAVKGIPVLDMHELAAGKLTALFGRRNSRDLLDVRRLLTTGNLNRERLRLAFVVYVAGQRWDWREASPDLLVFNVDEFERNLVPLMQRGFFASKREMIDFGVRLVEECQNSLDVVLPFLGQEREFLHRLSEHGEINASLLTTDEDLALRITRHPLLNWKALNVRRHREREGS